MYLFRVLCGARGFPYGSLSFSFAVLRTDSLVEGLSSSTRAKTWLRLTFAASFLFHSSSAFLFCWFYPSVPQCRLSHEIYAGTLVCSALLLAFIGVTLLDYNFNFFELQLLVYVVLCAFCFSVCFTTIYILIIKTRSLRYIHYMFKVVRSLGLGCSRRTFSVIVLSTCPLYPRNETVLPPLRIPGWR